MFSWGAVTIGAVLSIRPVRALRYHTEQTHYGARRAKSDYSLIITGTNISNIEEKNLIEHSSAAKLAIYIFGGALTIGIEK